MASRSEQHRIRVLAQIKAAQEDQRHGYMRALAEIRAGQKKSHWIWYIWPCLSKVRMTARPQFSLPDLEAARDYLRDPVLANRLIEITEVALEQLSAGVKPMKLFGGCTDAKKFQEVTTCFAIAAVENEDFVQARLFLSALQTVGGNLEQTTMGYIVGELGLRKYRGISTAGDVSAMLPPQEQESSWLSDGYQLAMNLLSGETSGGCPGPAERNVSSTEPQRPALNKSGVASGPTLVVEPRVPEAGLVIIFHGAGGSAHCFKDLADEWSQHLPHVKFILPTAPFRRTMTAWMGKNKATGALGNYEAQWNEVLAFIEEERRHRGVPLSRVVLMGYSNGALMASWVALNLPQPCAGLVLLSGLCPCPPRLPEPKLAVGVNQTPILYMCGTDDVQITAPVVRKHAQALLKKGFPVKFREFPGVGHELIQEELDEVLRFLTASLPASLPDPAEALNAGCAQKQKCGSNSSSPLSLSRSSTPGRATPSIRHCVRPSSSGRSGYSRASERRCSSNRSTSLARAS